MKGERADVGRPGAMFLHRGGRDRWVGARVNCRLSINAARQNWSVIFDRDGMMEVKRGDQTEETTTGVTTVKRTNDSAICKARGGTRAKSEGI